MNIVNTTMLGALIKMTGVVKAESLEEPLKERFGARAKSNLDACMRAYNSIISSEITTSGTKRAKSFKTEKALGWKDLKVGCVVTEAGNTKEFCTGDWKSQHPMWDDLFYCKGCGICAHECWPQAINMVEGT